MIKKVSRLPIAPPDIYELGREERLCKDCRWYRHEIDLFFTAELDWCQHPSLFRMSPVCGRVQLMGPPETMRADGGPCGPSGELFEQHRPWWRRLLRLR